LPKTYKDEDFIYDKIKPSILENTHEKTGLEEQRCIKALSKIKNKVICFIKKEGNTEYFKSPVLENIEIIENTLDYSTSSHLQNKKDLAYLLDDYRKYDTYSKKISTLKYNYNIPYLEYDHKFKKIDSKLITNYINNSILL